MKLITSLLLLTGLSFAQNATFNDFSPAAVRGVTIGQYHCYFWFGAIVPPPYTFEAACYDLTSTPQLFFSPPNKTSAHTIILDPGFEITWKVVPNGTHLDFTVTGKGPSDLTELPEVKVTL